VFTRKSIASRFPEEPVRLFGFTLHSVCRYSCDLEAYSSSVII